MFNPGMAFNTADPDSGERLNHAVDSSPAGFTAVLAQVTGGLAQLAKMPVDQLDEEGVRQCLDLTQRAAVLRDGVEARLIQVAEQREVTNSFGLTTAEWLHRHNFETLQTCRARVSQARTLEAHPKLAKRVYSGEISRPQALVAADTLTTLPDDLSPAEREIAHATMEQWCAEFDPHELQRLSLQLLEVVTPAGAEAELGQLLERQQRRAHNQRGLWLVDDHHGTLRIRGSLPSAAGAEFKTLIDAYAAKQFRNRRDEAPRGLITQNYLPTVAQLRADGLLDLVHHCLTTRGAPEHSGDRPRIKLTVPLANLQQGVGCGWTDHQIPISINEIRRLACDAEILPILVDHHGVPAWYAHPTRTFTGALRAAIHTRDGGCAFPGCDRSPADCEIHHITPWWDGGPTSINNGVALCKRHHTLVEPHPPLEHAEPASPKPRQALGRRWEVPLGKDRRPEFLPQPYWIRTGHHAANPATGQSGNDQHDGNLANQQMTTATRLWRQATKTLSARRPRCTHLPAPAVPTHKTRQAKKVNLARCRRPSADRFE